MFIPDNSFAFVSPPLNSSGDIYHTLGLLCILRNADLPLPLVRIGYFEKDSTECHARRAVEFSRALGFEQEVQTVLVPSPPVRRPPVVAKATRSALFSQLPEITIMDQKASTALISLFISSHSYAEITGLLRDQFTSYQPNVPEATRQASQAWQDTQWAKIQDLIGDHKRLLLFNERLGDIQPEQNSVGPDFDAIAASLQDAPTIACFKLLTKGKACVSSTESFSGAGEDGTQWDLAGFNTKLQHLQLLKRIYRELEENGRPVCVYGSTSGTLDAAALMGFNSLSLHRFPDSQPLELDDQDQRELLMSPFKKIGTRESTAAVLERFNSWLLGDNASIQLRTTDALRGIYTRAWRCVNGKEEEVLNLPHKGNKDSLDALLQRCLTR